MNRIVAMLVVCTALTALMCLLGCTAELTEETAPEADPAPAVMKVYNGTRQPTHITLSDNEVMAVVGIGFGRPNDASCSGTLISDTVILTAKHCTRGRSGNSFYAIFGTYDDRPELSIVSVAKHEHPQLDLALLELESAPGDRIDVTPIPIAASDLDDAQNGETFEQAGYGRTETGYSNGRFFVAEVFDGFSNGGQDLVVSGEGVHGVCFGDSGGPSMRVTPSGDVRVVGTLSNGESSCVGRDNYARTDLAREWIEQWTGPTPEEGATGCGDVTEEGSCADNRATWCENGALRSALCSGDTVCGFSDTVSGYRCIDDPNQQQQQEPDADGDGVPDDSDLCSNTPQGQAVWQNDEWMGCAGGQYRDRPPPQSEPQVGDDDSDGIANDVDLCLHTPSGRSVWTYGEWIGCAGGERRERSPDEACMEQCMLDNQARAIGIREIERDCTRECL